MNSRPSFAALLGLARSLLMYYAIPGRGRGWRHFYSRFVKPGDLCFDIGAHVGNRSAVLLALGASVVAVEPQPLFATAIRKLLGHKPQLTLLPLAVGAQAGQGTLLISQRTPTVSTLSADWAAEVSRTPGFSSVDWNSFQSVPVTTLDELIAQYGVPVFCKIDIEGQELDALNGLGTQIPLISFEYVPAAMERAYQCIARLLELGSYRFNLMTSEVPKLALADWVSADALRAELNKMPSTARAGEVYAQLMPNR